VKTAAATSLPDPAAEAEALIKEARRRQRRRYLAAGLAIVAAAGGTAGIVAGFASRTGQRPPSQHKPPSRAHVGRPKAAPMRGPILSGADTMLLTWPVGYPAFTATGGPPAYLEDLSTGRLSSRQIPGISGCDCQPYAIGVGRWVVYVGSGGAMAISPELKGKPRVLGATPFFAPAADPGHVWLVRFHGGYLGQAPVRVQSVPVGDGGQPGPLITLPKGAVNLVEGTDAGLLLQVRRGHNFGLALWNPGAAPRALPYSPQSDNGFAASARLIAYGTDCRWHITALHAALADVGYRACRVLRVLDVMTDRLFSFRTPPGTGGWVPNGFNLVSAISPGSRMIAAYAALRPPGAGRVRLYTTRLSGVAGRPRAVPASSALLFARTAWSAKGSWLLYQGPGEHLRAYRVTDGKTRSSTAPCCGYTVMVAAPHHPA
jgi:hypothetical protein